MTRLILIANILLCLSGVLHAQTSSPFKWELIRSGTPGIIELKAEIPANHYLYVKSTSFESIPKNAALQEMSAPVSEMYEDEYFGKTGIYPAPSAVWRFTVDPAKPPEKIIVKAQGCRKAGNGEAALCYMPERHEFSINSGIVAPKAVHGGDNSAITEVAIFKKLAERFVIRSSRSGYMDAAEFLRFLSGTESRDYFSGKSMLAVILLVILGGLGLNLTPCVLPMIPINLAIVGAGMNAKSKWSGFYRGGVYALGMALAYGLLGLFAILTGAQFGTLNSNPWFNFAIAAIFAILAMSMFGLFNIDLSRFGGRIPAAGADKGRLIAVFLLGATTALLAGACVAPIVIAVLVYAARLYADGNNFAILLPLLLGLGMALPWPLAGAGFAIMPRPGAWMTKIKYLFAVLITAFAGYYAYLGYNMLPVTGKGGADRQLPQLNAALERAADERRGIVIDFWASWCKSCLQMNATTLRDNDVVEALKPRVFIKFQAEDLSEPHTRAVLEHYQVPGLPTFIILEPR